MNRILTLLLFVFLTIQAFAQNQRETDSLLRIAEKRIPDTASVSAYLSLSQATLGADYEKSLGYAKSGLAAAEKLQDETWTGRSYFQLGLVQFSYGYAKEAIESYTSGIMHCRKIGAQYWEAKNLNGLGNAQRRMGRVKEATDSYLAAKTIFETLGDKKGIAGVYNNLGIIFMAEGQQEKALDYYRIARRMNIQINNQPWLAKNLSNMGTAFYNLGQYDSAEVYFKEALPVYESVGDLSSWAEDIMNLGNVYTSKKEYKSAREQFDRALRFDRENEREADMGFVFYNIAGLYTETGDYPAAKNYLDSSYTIALKYNDQVMLLEVYKGYTALYEGLGDFKNAYKYFTLYATKKDSTTSSDMKAQLDQMEESLREEKLKEQNETLLQSKKLQDIELNRSQIINYTAIGGIVLVLALAFTLYKRYQLKKKANVLLKERNHEIQSQKAIIEQKNLDISDSINYAKKIQDTLLPETEAFYAAFSDAFILFRPRNVVSGDFYWFSASGNTTCIAVADCTGHGVPGAFMSMLGIEKFNQAIVEAGITSPGGILAMVNRQMKTMLKQDERTGGMRDGMDVALVSIDTAKKQLAYAGANRPAWLVRNGQLTVLEPTKTSIGGHTPISQSFLQQEIALQPGDCIYLFSDGYADQFGGPKQKKMMTKKFQQLLLSCSSLSMQAQQQQLTTEFDAWKRDLEQVDDVCIIGIRIVQETNYEKEANY